MGMQFVGETDWDALVNHKSLDIEEEERLRQYIVADGYAAGTVDDLPQQILELYFDEWEQKGRP